LVMGHRLLWGNQSILSDCEHHSFAERLPLSEATRLLMNRCSGLLFAKEQLQREPFKPQNADFVKRNLAKAELALGDALLTVHGQFHWSCRQRAERLKTLQTDCPHFADVQRHHLTGVAFKLHPERSGAPPFVLQKDHDEISTLARDVWLWLEGRRLGRSFTSVRDYAASPLNKCPETKQWRNCLVHLKTFGPGALFSSKLSRDPRESLLNALTLLLWVPELFTDPALLSIVQTALRSSPRTFPELVQSYRALWSRFN